jgi:hypothetical protein
LSRLLVKRIFTTAFELVIETLLAGGRAMSADDLLVVSDAELLGTFVPAIRRQVLGELGRLPHVVLTARFGPRRPLPHRFVNLEVPGLTLDEARGLVADTYPDLEFAGSALHLLLDGCRSSEGIIPGRLFYLVELSRALVAPAGPSGDASGAREDPAAAGGPEQAPAPRRVLAPDEITAAFGLVRSAWQERTGKGRRP